MRDLTRPSLALMLAAAVAGASDDPPAMSAAEVRAAFGGEILPVWSGAEHRQYDFWLGRWEGNWRRREEGAFFHQAEGNRADHDLVPILDGKALVELVSGQKPGATGRKTRGFSVRYYDPHAERWVMAQNWPAPNTSGGFLDQLRGRETWGRIEVYSTYRDGEERKITRRYSFSDIRPGAFRWDDHYTGDGGVSWHPGSIVEFRRVAGEGRWPAAGEAMPSWESGDHCDEAAFESFDFLAGGWSGTVRFPDGAESPAEMVAFGILDGCAVMSTLRYERDGRDVKLFEARSYAPRSRRWLVYRLDNQPGTVHEYQVGVLEGGRLELVTAPALVIRDELEEFRPDPEAPGRPERRTLWPEVGGDRIGFDLQESGDAGATWTTVAAVRLERVWSP